MSARVRQTGSAPFLVSRALVGGSRHGARTAAEGRPDRTRARPIDHAVAQARRRRRGAA